MHRIAWVDRLRENPTQALVQIFPPKEGSNQPALPAPVRVLTALFARSNKPGTGAFRKAACSRKKP